MRDAVCVCADIYDTIRLRKELLKMPLILLGLLVIIGIVIYALIIYGNSDDEVDTRPVRERYSHVFDRFRRGANYTIIDDDEEDEDDDKPDAGKGDGHTMFFPTDAEVEKRKRNIH